MTEWWCVITKDACFRHFVFTNFSNGTCRRTCRKRGKAASMSFDCASYGSDSGPAFRTTLVRRAKLDALLSQPPAGIGEKLRCVFATLCFTKLSRAHLSLLRILYHSRHVSQTLFQRLRELHRVGPAVAVEGRDREDEAVLSYVVGASVTVRHHRPVSDDHIDLRGYLWGKPLPSFQASHRATP